MFNSLKENWRKLSARDQKILIVGSIIVSLILLIKYALIPVFDWREDLKSKLQYNKLTLEKITRAINSRSELESEKNRLLQHRTQIEHGLIKARDADLASAQIIKTLRDLAQKVGISTSRISTNKSRDTESLFQEITLSIPSMRCNMKQLYDFLINIKQAPEILAVKELRIRVANAKDPSEVTVNMEVSGYMMKPTPVDQKKDSKERDRTDV